MKLFFIIDFLSCVIPTKLLIKIYVRALLDEHVELTRNNTSTQSLINGIRSCTPAASINPASNLLTEDEAEIKKRIALISVKLWRLVFVGYSTGTRSVDEWFWTSNGAPVTAEIATILSQAQHPIPSVV
jgi:hypothetical protein